MISTWGGQNGGIPPPYTPSLPPSVSFHRSTSHLFSPYQQQPSLASADPQTPQMWLKPSNSSWWKYQSSQVVSMVLKTDQNVDLSNNKKCLKAIIYITSWFVMRSSFLILVISSSLPFQMCLSLLRGPPAQVNVTTAPWSPPAAHIFLLWQLLSPKTLVVLQPCT